MIRCEYRAVVGLLYIAVVWYMTHIHFVMYTTLRQLALLLYSSDWLVVIVVLISTSLAAVEIERKINLYDDPPVAECLLKLSVYNSRGVLHFISILETETGFQSSSFIIA
jgi:hypothetical protein